MAHDPFASTNGTKNTNEVALLYREIEGIKKEIRHYVSMDEQSHKNINRELELIKDIALSNRMVLERYKGIAGGAALVLSGVWAIVLMGWEWFKTRLH